MLTVIVPTCIAILYYGFFASDVYISESRFLVRSPQHQTQGGLFGELLQGSGLTHSKTTPTRCTTTFCRAMPCGNSTRKLGVRKAFTSKQVDPINRFPVCLGTIASRSSTATTASM